MRTRKEAEDMWHNDTMTTETLKGMQVEHLKHIFLALLDIRDLLANPPTIVEDGEPVSDIKLMTDPLYEP
jgi:hypothetical protein